MAVLNGNDLVLGIATTATTVAFAHSQSASISFSNSLIDTTTKDSASWEEMISGRKSWSLSTDGLVDFAAVSGATNTVGFATLALAGTEVFVRFGVDGGDAYTGSAFIESFELSSTSDDVATYSVSLKGTGVLTAVTS